MVALAACSTSMWTSTTSATSRRPFVCATVKSQVLTATSPGCRV
jgi:hypothetical protein